MALKHLSTRLLAAVLVGAIMLPSVAVTSAEAGDRRHGWHDRHGGGWNGHHRGPRRHGRDRDNGGDVAAAIALGVIGLAAGAAIASSASQPDYIDPPYYGPDYGYVPDRDTYIDPAHRNTGFRKPYYPDAPTVVTGSLEPWTSEWYAYCADRYRSFDARSGTYTTYSGEKRFCR